MDERYSNNFGETITEASGTNKYYVIILQESVAKLFATYLQASMTPPPSPQSPRVEQFPPSDDTSL